MWIELSFRNKPVVFSVVYRHPRKKSHQRLDFQKQLKNNLETLEDKNIRYYIAGDFNFNLLRYCSNNDVKFYVDDIHGVGCQFLIDKPTRIRNGKCSIVDHILTNDMQNSLTPGILLADVSDHLRYQPF